MTYVQKIRNLFCVSIALLLTNPALAADAAKFKNLGFSQDGKIYAFEEYGIQDGSGFAYSSIYLVDTEKDIWITPSPFRSQANDEFTSLRSIRDQALNQATSQLRRYGISYDGDHLVSRKLADLDSSNNAIAFALSTNNALFRNDRFAELVHNTFPMRSPNAYCDSSGRQTQGFGLIFAVDNQAKTVYKDRRLGKTRGCPYSYAISEVLRQEDKIVVIMSVRSRGFEGLDRRFIAIPFSIPFE